MGDPACGLLEAELALDRLEAELATELPAHLRAFASAHAAATPAPPAPAAARRPGSLAIARRALAHPLLAERAIGILRLVAPLVVEDDPAVAAARAAERSWPAYATLAAARDTAARGRFGLGFLALIHRLHGVHGAPETDPALAASAPGEPILGADPGLAAVDGWSAPCEPIPRQALEQAWRDLATRHGARGTCRIVRAPSARPRAFVVEPTREVTIVIGDLATPASRFAALHELGHALAALVAGALPRVVDEAAAAYVARYLELEGALDLAWFTPLAAPARARRAALAAALAAIELRGPAGSAISRPPWALWHDPGAQAAYVAAAPLADRWWSALGPDPDAGALAALLVDERARIDRSTTL